MHRMSLFKPAELFPFPDVLQESQVIDLEEESSTYFVLCGYIKL